MKRYLLLIMVMFSCAYASSPDQVASLSSKVILQSTNGYFVLSDGSCWKVIPFSKRWRSISEWWNNVQLVPENYESLPKDWFLGTEIEAYSKYGNLEVNESDAANQEMLKQCTHLLMNARTGQVLFGIAMDPAECIVHLFQDAHADGHRKGVSDGRAENATNSYNAGFTEGRKIGYAEGYQAGLKARN